MPLAADTLLDRFRRLHAAGCFVIPNPWDLGSAHYLERRGFHALATTSSGYAWSLGLADNRVALDAVLANLRALATAVQIPVNADFEGGFAIDPADVASNVGLAANTGVAGISIEDSTGDAANPLFEFALAVARVQAARAALDRVAPKIVLTARTEGFIVGRPDLTETIKRLQAFAAVGADCLYAPGLRTPDEIAAVVTAVAPKPVNVLIGSDFISVAELAKLGVRRISVGGALARSAWGEFMRAANEIATDGTFSAFRQAAPFAEVNGLFKER
ncbi:MAG: isocitrate lyase/phosphoenolpyruvate mutase family protein [Gammaproteobacteria bacterium]|nr:isocitrate lyase/phosphoenolpyruvate mutase family protein [Gammaproteobacteria bacterium]